MTSDLLDHDLELDVRYVCGADEAGRGCMAGGIVCAAVRFDYKRLKPAALSQLSAVHDSKRLSPTKRAALSLVVLELADAVSVSFISTAAIDDDGGDHGPNMRGLTQTLTSVAAPGSVNLVDYYKLADAPLAHRAVDGGDHTSAAIAAASILAKETRDRLMYRIDALYPGYGLAAHKGYHTGDHIKAVEVLGPTPQHRQSSKACRAATAVYAAVHAA